LIDHLFARANQPAPLESVTVRILHPPAVDATPPAPTEGHPGEWRTTSPDIATRSGPHARFSGAEIDQLVDKVTRAIKRRDRLERESRGIL